jgi:hypothetical protein
VDGATKQEEKVKIGDAAACGHKLVLSTLPHTQTGKNL